MSSKFEIKFNKKADRIIDEIEDLGKGRQVSFDELFNVRFMNKYTNFSTIQELFDTFDPTLTEEKVKEVLETSEWSNFIAKNTRFNSWEEMYKKSGELYLSEKLSDIFNQ